MSKSEQIDCIKNLVLHIQSEFKEIYDRCDSALYERESDSTDSTKLQPCDECEDSTKVVIWQVKNRFKYCPYCGRKL